MSSLSNSPAVTESISLKCKLTIVAMTILATFAVLEVGIRSYDGLVGPGDGFFSKHRNVVAGPIKPIIPFRTFGFTPYADYEEVRYISSRHGELYPIVKPEGTYRIVVFGGSTTENKNVVAHGGEHYPLQLQNRLRERLGREDIEVINVANAAYATPHSLIMLALDVLSWDPDLVVLSHNANDLSATYWPDFTFDYSNKYSDEFYIGQEISSRFSVPNVLFQHFQLYWVLKKNLGRIAGDTCKYQVDCNRLDDIRESYGPQPNPLGRRIFKRNLRSFVTLAKSQGIEVLLASQAHSSQVVPIENETQNNNGVTRPLNDEWRSHSDSYNRAIEEVANEMNIWFMDNAKSMKGKDQYFIDRIHYTSAGVTELANNFSDFIISVAIIK